MTSVDESTELKGVEEKNLGNEAYKKKDFVTALAHYDKACEADPTNHLFFNNKSATLLAMGKYEKCIAQCEEVLRVKPDPADSAMAYALMANAQVKLGQAKEALLSYEKSLSAHRNPDVVKKHKQLKEDIEKIEKTTKKKETEKAKSAEVKKAGSPRRSRPDVYVEKLQRARDSNRHHSRPDAYVEKLHRSRDSNRRRSKSPETKRDHKKDSEKPRDSKTSRDHKEKSRQNRETRGSPRRSRPDVYVAKLQRPGDSNRHHSRPDAYVEKLHRSRDSNRRHSKSPEMFKNESRHDKYKDSKKSDLKESAKAENGTKPEEKKPALCRFYNLGRGCRKGENCKFLHEPKTKKSQSDIKPKGKKKRSDNEEGEPGCEPEAKKKRSDNEEKEDRKIIKNIYYIKNIEKMQA